MNPAKTQEFTSDELRRLWHDLYRDEVARLAGLMRTLDAGDHHARAAAHADRHVGQVGAQAARSQEIAYRQDQAIRFHLALARTNLEGWTEPHGQLVPTEPDKETRARIRISLRGFISGLLLASGETSPPPGFEADDHRDLQRIRDAAVAEAAAA